MDPMDTTSPYLPGSRIGRRVESMTEDDIITDALYEAMQEYQHARTLLAIAERDLYDYSDAAEAGEIGWDRVMTTVDEVAAATKHAASAAVLLAAAKCGADDFATDPAVIAAVKQGREAVTLGYV